MRIPLDGEQVLFLQGDHFDSEELLQVLSPLGLNAFLTTREELAKQHVKKLLSEQGISALWRTTIFEEALLAPTRDKPALVAVLKDMLQRLAPTSDFIIVDRFLFPDKRKCPDDYLDMLLEILEPIAKEVQQLLVVTSKNHNVQLRTELEKRLQITCPGCHFRYCCSDKCHDRFWIADRDRGLFVGTSLNGLGQKYALADYLAADDVQEIVAALNNEGALDATLGDTGHRG